MGSEKTFDLIVVGAGITGLVAADICQQNGLSVKVLEGRGRVGGRTYTKQESYNSRPTWFDFGAHFVGQDTPQKDVWDLIKELGLEVFPQYEGPEKKGELWDGQGANLLTSWSDAGPGFSKTKAYIGEIYPPTKFGLATLAELKVLLGEMKILGLDHFFLKAHYDQLSVTEWVNDWGAQPETLSLVRMLCRVGFSAEPEDISMLWFVFYLYSSGGLDAFTNLRYPTQGAQGYRLVKGAQSISEALAQRITRRVADAISLNSKVTALDFSQDDAMVLLADGSKLAARKVLVATSPKLAGQIATTPALPPERVAAAQAMSNGQTVMTVVHFKSAFWRSDTKSYFYGTFNGSDVENISANGLSGNAMIVDGPIVWTMDNVSYEGAPAMFAFVVGEMALKWQAMSEKERLGLIRYAMGQIFGSKPVDENFVSYEEYLWTTDPFAQGCPTGHFGPGRFLPSKDHILLDWMPDYMGGRLFFASTEAATVSNGYMSGAVWAGKKVAGKIIG